MIVHLADILYCTYGYHICDAQVTMLCLITGICHTLTGRGYARIVFLFPNEVYGY